VIPLRVGLTGGIGSGKSTAAAMFAELGAPVLDLDKVGHAVVAPGSDGLRRLVDEFGTGILAADGALDRRRLGEYCFADAERTQRLNVIMHPLIRQAEMAWLQCQQGGYTIIEASVLIESGGAGRMDRVIVVLADLAIRRARVLARGDRNGAQFDAIVARQCDDEARRAAADFTIINNGTQAELRRQVERIDAQLRGGG